MTHTDTRGYTDGHMLTITFEDKVLGGVIRCPHAGKDFTGVPWIDRPTCRQAYLPDARDEYSNPVPDLEADPNACLVAAGWADLGEEALDTAGVQISAPTPVPVAYDWDDDGYLTVRPVTSSDGAT